MTHSGSEFEGYVEEDEDVYADDEIEQMPPNTSPVVDVGASRTFQQTNAEPLFTTSATPSLSPCATSSATSPLYPCSTSSATSLHSLSATSIQSVPEFTGFSVIDIYIYNIHCAATPGLKVDMSGKPPVEFFRIFFFSSSLGQNF